MSADLTKREVCKQSQQQLKTPMILGDETNLIPIVANFFATAGFSQLVSGVRQDSESVRQVLRGERNRWK